MSRNSFDRLRVTILKRLLSAQLVAREPLYSIILQEGIKSARQVLMVGASDCTEIRTLGSVAHSLQKLNIFEPRLESLKVIEQCTTDINIPDLGLFHSAIVPSGGHAEWKMVRSGNTTHLRKVSPQDLERPNHEIPTVVSLTEAINQFSSDLSLMITMDIEGLEVELFDELHTAARQFTNLSVAFEFHRREDRRESEIIGLLSRCNLKPVLVESAWYSQNAFRLVSAPPPLARRNNRNLYSGLDEETLRHLAFPDASEILANDFAGQKLIRSMLWAR